MRAEVPWFGHTYMVGDGPLMVLVYDRRIGWKHVDPRRPVVKARERRISRQLAARNRRQARR